MDYYILIAGSRGFSPYSKPLRFPTIETNLELASLILGRMFAEQMKNFDITVVAGGARGADDVGRLWAGNNSFAYKEFKANWDLYGKGAGFIRNDEMYKFLSEKENKCAVLFWDGQSHGTADNFKRAEKYNVELICYNYVTNEFLK